jgi:hypothetical protein
VPRRSGLTCAWRATVAAELRLGMAWVDPPGPEGDVLLRAEARLGPATHGLLELLRPAQHDGYFMIRTESVTEIPLQFYQFHLRFLS